METFQLEDGFALGQLVKIHVGNQHWTIVVETMPQGQPKIVRSHALHLVSHLRKRLPGRSNCYGLIMAPFISPKSADICKASSLGYVDLSGNSHLNFDQVFIDIRTAQNPFHEKREIRSLFTPKAGCVLKALLTPPLHAWRVEELAKESGVSLGHVSNVRKRLLDHEWAQIADNGLQLTNPEELARAWQPSYEPRPLERKTYYTVLHGETLESAVRSALSEAGLGEHAVLSSFSAAHWIAPYARQGTHFFYADPVGTNVLQHHLQLEELVQGANVVIENPLEDDLFKKRIEPSPGIWCSDLVQTWLDLSATGERGREAAEHFMTQKLLPEWTI